MLGLLIGLLAGFAATETLAGLVPAARFTGGGFLVVIALAAVFSHRWALRRAGALDFSRLVLAFLLAVGLCLVFFRLDFLLFETARPPLFGRPDAALFSAIFALLSMSGLAAAARSPRCSRCGRYQALEPFNEIALDTAAQAKEILQAIAASGDFKTPFGRFKTGPWASKRYQFQRAACPGCGLLAVRLCLVTESAKAPKAGPYYVYTEVMTAPVASHPEKAA